MREEVLEIPEIYASLGRKLYAARLHDRISGRFGVVRRKCKAGVLLEQIFFD